MCFYTQRDPKESIHVIISPSPLGSSLFQHLHVPAERLLDGVFGDEVDKVLDVGLSVGRELVDGFLPHHGFGDLPGMVCEMWK